MKDLDLVEIKNRILEAGEIIKKNICPKDITEKTNKHDLVTNVDKEVEIFFRKKINDNYPEDGIIAEEKMGKKATSMKNRVWILDPIDGTANFIFERKNFAIMLGIYEDNKPIYGAIYDVMNEELWEGKTSLGVFVNGKKYELNKNLSLDDGIIELSSVMLTGHRNEKFYNLINKSRGFRVRGACSIEAIYVFKGLATSAVHTLAKAWDVAAVDVIAKELGLISKSIDGGNFDFLDDELPSIVAFPKAYDEIMKILKK
ncbi:MAG: inositol monophosphatase family protein [Peptoniphilaceae bacterium]|nr:inositol monophosphatase family protein [Peptoniphilaceae bacterium]MDD7383743.1 inositol monophosphatase family protein [Peptoniphilaceae bacterium]MDY3737857.1 inositol monophosphatase family protein [Peptoniphilaceae bacterium]